MQYREFINSLKLDTCPGGLEPSLQALWFEAAGEWDTAHEIIQQVDDVMAARVHAYLHRKEGNERNSRYWHRQAGTVYPEDTGFQDEWDGLVRELFE